MGKFLRRSWIVICVVFMITTVFESINNDLSQADLTVSASETVEYLSSGIASSVCPIPPLGYEQIPGYDPGRVDPSQSDQLLAFISPTLEGNPVFYMGILQQPVKFCGIANGDIERVELLASGAYIYEVRYPDPAEPELLLGEASVENDIWFFDYDFREGGQRQIVANGYNAANDLVATTEPILITLAEPNPS